MASIFFWTAPQSLGSPQNNTKSRICWSLLGEALKIQNTNRLVMPKKSLSARADLGMAFSVESQPSKPWRVGFQPVSFLTSRQIGRYRQFSNRSKYRRISAAFHDGSPVTSAIASQSA